MIFLVGPGGAGKSSVGPLLADLLQVTFVDLDTEFCGEVADIPTYIRERGYRAYCEANAVLAESIVNGSSGDLVLATSSGFLVHDGCDDIVERNLALIRRTGTSVYLQPARDLDGAATVLAFRQVRRYPGLDLAAEAMIAHARCGRYETAADCTVLADCDPHEVANLISVELLLRQSHADGTPPGP